MTNQHDDPYTVVETATCGDAQELMDAIYGMCERDPRGEATAQATAVAIDYKFVEVELRQYEDGTRTFALKGV